MWKRKLSTIWNLEIQFLPIKNSIILLSVLFLFNIHVVHLNGRTFLTYNHLTYFQEFAINHDVHAKFPEDTVSDSLNFASFTIFFFYILYKI